MSCSRTRAEAASVHGGCLVAKFWRAAGLLFPHRLRCGGAVATVFMRCSTRAMASSRVLPCGVAELCICKSCRWMQHRCVVRSGPRGYIFRPNIYDASENVGYTGVESPTHVRPDVLSTQLGRTYPLCQRTLSGVDGFGLRLSARFRSWVRVS